MIKKIAFVALLCILLAFSAFADEARDISGEVDIVCDGIGKAAAFDRNLRTFSVGDDVTVTLKSEIPIGGIWLRYSDTPVGGSANGKTICEHGFWSEYVPINGEDEVVLTFDKVALCEMYVYSEGELPSEVQTFGFSQSETDLMLFAAHSDDDQLFFAGLLPYYIARGNVDVKVCFFTTSYQEISRVHELLSGLWHCGVKNYPIILPLPDEYSESFEGARRLLENQGYSYDAVKALIRDVLNTYKPQVVVLHDFDGEYGHGAHIFATATIVDTIENPSENDFTPHKVYVHLYKENEIVLPIDEPLDAFGGKSAFNVSQEAFKNHKSQHWTWFYGWIYGSNGSITKASQIRTYSPLYYGLYFTDVGADVSNDMLDNIETHSDRAVREENERRAAEEAAALQLANEKDMLEKEVARIAENIAGIPAPEVKEVQKSEDGIKIGHFLPIVAAVIIVLFLVIAVIKKARK